MNIEGERHTLYTVMRNIDVYGIAREYGGEPCVLYDEILYMTVGEFKQDHEDVIERIALLFGQRKVDEMTFSWLCDYLSTSSVDVTVTTRKLITEFVSVHFTLDDARAYIEANKRKPINYEGMFVQAHTQAQSEEFDLCIKAVRGELARQSIIKRGLEDA